MTIRSYLRQPIKSISASGKVEGLREGKSFMPPVYALSRRQCSFSRTRLQATNRNGLRAAQLKAMREQRFQFGRIKIVQDSSDPKGAGVWGWDEAQNLESGEDLSALRVFPETLLREPPASDPTSNQNRSIVRLVKCLEGFEGQIWRNETSTQTGTNIGDKPGAGIKADGATLIASRWWPTIPSINDWRLFLRIGKFDPETDEGQSVFMSVPAPQDVPWRNDIALIDRDPEGLARLFSPLHVGVLAAGFLAFFAAFQAGQLISHGSAINSLEQKLARATELNQNGFRLKRQAEARLASLNSKSNLKDPTYVLRVIQEISSKFDPNDAEIRNIQISETNFKIRLEVEDPEELGEVTLDIPEVVSQLENSSLFSNVFVEGTVAGAVLLEGNLEASIPALTLAELPADTRSGAGASEVQKTPANPVGNPVANPAGNNGEGALNAEEAAQLDATSPVKLSAPPPEEQTVARPDGPPADARPADAREE